MFDKQLFQQRRNRPVVFFRSYLCRPHYPEIDAQSNALRYHIRMMKFIAVNAISMARWALSRTAVI